jgi:energy-coupling factor transporter ATP-binding protein EcfA2
MPLIKDLINLPEIKTVIQLSDLQDERLKRFLTQSFVLTQEVTFGLNHLLKSFSAGEGRGCFIQGNFGSGKSHFLTVLSLLLSYSESWEPLIKQDSTFDNFRNELVKKRYLTLNISLVEHGGREYLEEIVLKELSGCIKQNSLPPLVQKESRKETFETAKEELKRTGVDGLVILIDELSEFLKSKPDSRRFNEDVRFLQFLGEIASGFPLWVVATLQERIEETGEITQEVFNKIKDRYPLRFSLGSSHIEELVSARLVEKKPEAHDLLINLFNQIKEAFPTFPFSQDLFLSLYPVHPAAIRLLDNLKTLFSQQRGVVDFIHYQIRGDASRKIEGMLNLPINCLLTPDAVFDHFRYRIKEMIETNPFHDIVFKFYEDEMERLFPKEAERQLALF